MTPRYMPPEPTRPKKTKVTREVATEAQARELEAAWPEIVAGQQPRTEVLERDRAAVTSWEACFHLTDRLLGWQRVEERLLVPTLAAGLVAFVCAHFWP